MTARDQNGNRLSRDIHPVRLANGKDGWACKVWFGSAPATNVRVNVYATRKAARNGDISDDYNNCSALLAIGFNSLGDA